MANTAYNCIRRTFCWLNIILWLCSCAILATGAWLYLSYRGYATLLPDHLVLSADTLFLTIGVVGFVSSFLGCCGAWIESRCFLLLYITVIVTLFLSEFLIGSMAFVFRGGLSRTLINELRYGIEQHYNNSDRGSIIAPSVAAIWDSIQNSFECCGVVSHEDWYNIELWPGKNWVPESCCKSASFSDTSSLSEGTDFNVSITHLECGKMENPMLWWRQGCIDSLNNWFVERLNVISSVGLAIGCVQLFGLLISLLLLCFVQCKSKTETYKSYTQTSELQSPISRTWEE